MRRLTKSILTTSSNLLPNFNDDLLLEFRKRKIDEIVNYIDILFKESIKLFDERFNYIGYRVLSPDERIEYLKNNPIFRKRITIQKDSFIQLAFIFTFEGIEYPLHVLVPYLDHKAVIVKDTKYYPLLPIVERGGLHRTNKEIIIKVMRAPITFKRNIQYAFETNKLNVYRCTVVTVKIHQRKTTKKGKKGDRTPLILYHLVNMGFYGTMRYYNFSPGEIDIVQNIDETATDYSYIKLKDYIYIKVADSALKDKFKQRVIASFIMCLNEYSTYTIRDLLADNNTYYITTLGKFTYPASVNKTLLCENAQKHLQTTKTLLDPPAKYQLASINIHVNDIYDLLRVVFYEIDNWMVGHDPTDLYNKKIGALDQLMSPLVAAINKKLFEIINNKDEGFNAETVKKFVTTASQSTQWINNNPIFRANPTIYNGNWLITIGAKRFRSLDNIENKQGVSKTASTNLPVSVLKAHPSQLIVESILNVPPSSPVVTGEINPFLNIDNDGNILVDQELREQIEHVYD